MKKLKIVCIALGLLHAAVMTAFALGAELSPLMVYIVDYPIAYFTVSGEPAILALGLPIIICSVVYPGIIYVAGALVLILAKKKAGTDNDRAAPRRV